MRGPGCHLIISHLAIDVGARTPLILQTVLGLDAGRVARACLAQAVALTTDPAVREHLTEQLD